MMNRKFLKVKEMRKEIPFLRTKMKTLKNVLAASSRGITLFYQTFSQINYGLSFIRKVQIKEIKSVFMLSNIMIM